MSALEVVTIVVLLLLSLFLLIMMSKSRRGCTYKQTIGYEFMYAFVKFERGYDSRALPRWYLLGSLLVAAHLFSLKVLVQQVQSFLVGLGSAHNGEHALASIIVGRLQKALAYAHKHTSQEEEN